MQQPGRQLPQQLLHLIGKQRRMNLQMKTHPRSKLPEQLQQTDRPPGRPVKSTIQQPNIPNTMIPNNSQAFPNTLHGQHPHGFLHPTHAKSTSIKTPPRRFQLHEWLCPIEKTTVFRNHQLIELHHPRQSPIMIHTLRIQPTQPHNLIPPGRTIVHPQPLVKSQLTLSPKHTSHMPIPTQIPLIIPQHLRSPEYNGTFR